MSDQNAYRGTLTEVLRAKAALMSISTDAHAVRFDTLNQCARLAAEQERRLRAVIDDLRVCYPSDPCDIANRLEAALREETAQERNDAEI